jgi:CRP-like cAMP-binding protein
MAPFTVLSSDTLNNLAATTVRTEHKAGEIIYQRGTVADELYVLGQGRLEMLAIDASGRERIANTLGPGTILGLSGLSHGQPHATTARASTDVVLFRLSRSAFEAAIGGLHWPSMSSFSLVSHPGANIGDGERGADTWSADD